MDGSYRSIHTGCHGIDKIDRTTANAEPVGEVDLSAVASVVLFNESWGIQKDECMISDLDELVNGAKVSLEEFSGVSRECARGA